MLAIGKYSLPSSKPLSAKTACPGCQTTLYPGNKGHRWFRQAEKKWLVVCPNCYGKDYVPGENPLPTNAPTEDEQEIVVVETKPVPSHPLDCISVLGKHYQAEITISVMKAGEYPFLFGSPGAGKSHLIESFAREANLAFLLCTFGQDAIKSELVGSVSPLNGMYYSTKFREIAEHGGIVLFDETCLAPGSFLNLLNAAMAQRVMCFPDGATIQLHPNCYFVFADNSNGWGNDPIFPERNDIGGALRNRLTYINFKYDDKLQLRIIKSIFNGNKSRAEVWNKAVLDMRKAVEPLMSPVVISPRFAYRAAKFFNLNMEPKTVFELSLREGLPDDIWNPVWNVVKHYAVSY